MIDGTWWGEGREGEQGGKEKRREEKEDVEEKRRRQGWKRRKSGRIDRWVKVARRK